MWTPLTFAIRTFVILLVISDVIHNLKHNIVTVKRIKIRERSRSAVNTTQNPFWDKLSPERRARCRRYAQQYYSQAGYPVYPSIEFSQQYPDYSQYYVQPQYVPSKCYNYCLQCPTSTCRRRCHMLPNAPPVPSQGSS